jgi:hypothetical protein
MYVDTGHAPRSHEEREKSKFTAAFGDPLTLDYKDLKLDAVNFAEPKDPSEKQKDGTRRKPRASIGNTNSVWLSHAGLVSLMRELGFPYHEVVSDRPIIPRLRTAFFREEPRPTMLFGQLSQPLPDEIPQREAVANCRLRDVKYLKGRGRSVLVCGRDPLLTPTIEDLRAQSITVDETILLPGGPDDPIGLGTVRKVLQGKSGLLVLAVPDPHDVIFRIMLLDQFDYIFSSFSMCQKLEMNVK